MGSMEIVVYVWYSQTQINSTMNLSVVVDVEMGQVRWNTMDKMYSLEHNPSNIIY